MQPAGAASASRHPLHDPIARLFTPLVRLVGSVNVKLTFWLAEPVAVKRPEVASPTAIVLLTPGNTFWKSRGAVPETVIACKTLAVTLMFALCALAFDAATRVAATTAVETFAQRCMILSPRCNPAVI